MHSFARYSSLLSLSISNLPQFLRYQSVGTATGPTALCGIQTTPRIDILSPEIQPSDPLVERAGIEPASLVSLSGRKRALNPLSHQVATLTILD